ncbi:MAG: hypothetical protein L0154_10050 [Chloroflexi bacterium]|nr:hypothetical protein [Chloroflexota bacterium]
MINITRSVWGFGLSGLALALRKQVGDGVISLLNLENQMELVQGRITYFASFGVIFGIAFIIILMSTLLMESLIADAMRNKRYSEVVFISNFSRAVFPYYGQGRLIEGYRMLALTMLGDFDGARKVEKKFKDEMYLHHVLALVELSKGRMEEALANTPGSLKHYKEALKLATDKEPILEQVTEAMIELGDCSKALQACKQLFNNSKSQYDVAQAEALAAWAYARMSDIDKVKALMKTAAPRIKDAPADEAADFHYRIGKTFEALYDRKRAARHFQMSYEVHPDGILGVRAQNALMRLNSMAQFQSVRS